MDAFKDRIAYLPERVRWALTLAYVALIYATLPVSRNLVLSLRDAHVLQLVVTTLYLVVGGVVLWLMLFLYRIRDLAAYVLMTVLAVILGYFVLGLEVMEERVHFVQYGLLAVGVCYSLRPRVDAPFLYLATAVLAAAFGFVDEGLQFFIPNRVFDWRDVGFNTMAAGFGTGFAWIFRAYLVEGA